MAWYGPKRIAINLIQLFNVMWSRLTKDSSVSFRGFCNAD